MLSALAHVRSRRMEAQFLPPALEIIETPASPLRWALGGSLTLLAVAALAWAWFGRIDIVAVAPGRIVPSGFTKVVQPVEGGRIRAIHIREGEEVVAGQPLIELDTSDEDADMQRSRQDRQSSLLDIARTEALLEATRSGADPAALYKAPQGVDPAQIARDELRLMAEYAEHMAKVEGIRFQRQEQERNRDVSIATADMHMQLQPLLRERFETLSKLSAAGNAPRLHALDAEQRHIENQSNLASSIARGKQADATVASLAEKERQALAEDRAKWLTQLAAARLKLAEAEQMSARAANKMARATLVAPVDGTVFQLATTTIGGVVTPAQQLMTIVPRTAEIQVEASLENKDVGFVTPGQHVAIKVDAYPFTRYGMLEGKVERLSMDSATMPDPKANEKKGSGARAAESPGAVSAYTVSVALTETHLSSADGPLVLRPGMTVAAEILTGRRRFLEYMLAPLMERAHGAARER